MSSVYKTADEVYTSLKSDFEERVGEETQVGSVIDMFNKTVASECGDMYDYIEANKNPYLFTNTSGDDLDSLGYWVGITREDDEADEHYKYRLKDWVLSSEASNTTAIENVLLNPTYSSNIQYVPYTHGAGTATCYVIPVEYEEETIANALAEAASLIKDTVSPSLYVEYIAPAIIGVRFECYLVTSGEEATIRSNIEDAISEYVNAIAPDDYLKIGDIVKLGLNQEGVEYFNVVSYYIDDELQSNVSKIQELETKMIFDSITWVDVSTIGI